MGSTEPLKMELAPGKARQLYLQEIRAAVMKVTEELCLGILINEIAKNIFDHAGGTGYLEVIPENGSFRFLIKDHGQESYDFEFCQKNSTKKGNGQNFGIGLESIGDIANDLGIDIKIDTTRGFSYSGVFTPK